MMVDLWYLWHLWYLFLWTYYLYIYIYVSCLIAVFIYQLVRMWTYFHDLCVLVSNLSHRISFSVSRSMGSPLSSVLFVKLVRLSIPATSTSLTWFSWGWTMRDLEWIWQLADGSNMVKTSSRQPSFLDGPISTWRFQAWWVSLSR